ncbi:MAG: glycosyltransferase [Sporocytophaga sp.]|nr:glycosyltransferase [Sporocytophaga sp.]
MIIVIIALIFLIYSSALIWAFGKWRKMETWSKSKKAPTAKFVSVIIPVRNEESNIINLLSDLSKQQYPKSKYEVIVIDDGSEDFTVSIVQEYLERSDIQLTVLHSNDYHSNAAPKKKAIEYGISRSEGELILTIDGDCRCGEHWIATMAGMLEVSDCKMVCGPVGFDSNGTLFEKMQQIEFSAVMGTGGVCLASGFPTMANGANLCYEKEAFNEVGGFSGFEKIASGDDEFLLHKIYEKYPGKVSFVCKKEALVKTYPKASVKEFLEQRKRWAGKWKMHKNKRNQYLALFIFIVNFLFLVSGAYSLMDNRVLLVFAGFAIVKFVAEFLFLKQVSRLLNHQFNLIEFAITWAFYPFYVITIGLLGNSGSYVWKGREIKN